MGLEPDVPFAFVASETAGRYIIVQMLLIFNEHKPLPGCITNTYHRAGLRSSSDHGVTATTMMLCLSIGVVVRDFKGLYS